ncbi:MAG: GGDEF domain-containing phosphodiesterase, partial [Chthoniobacterales bacterium]|nr:GGDEF domain-containing phosphodiesterase [Chthoniobacterales bacterium]
IRPSCSIGITALHHDYTPQELLKEADLACYRAKSLGKNRVEVYVRFDENLLEPKPILRETLELEEQILKNDELELWFQPVCDLTNGQIFYQEALIRFVSVRSANPIQASHFMSQLTDRTNSEALDRFVIYEIIHHLVKNPDLVASVNISAISVTEWRFADMVIQLLDKYQIEPGRLFLEITETHSITDLNRARAVLNRLSERGVQCMLDDLGAGFSSIVILKTLPIQIVKIDGSLIEDSHREGFNRVFLDALEVFSRGVGFLTVAERIETFEELQTAKNHGIHFGQGYLIAKPRKFPYKNHEIPKDLFIQPSTPLSE